jgi:hypothetical protein
MQAYSSYNNEQELMHTMHASEACSSAGAVAQVPTTTAKLAAVAGLTFFGGGGGNFNRIHVRSKQEWHCLPRWEATVKDRC